MIERGKDMKATNLLIQEHKLLLRALDVLDAMSESMSKGGSLESNDVGKILDFLRWFADAHHQAKEETILFPALRAAAAAHGRAVDHMMLEHGQERSRIEQLEKDLRTGDLADFKVVADRLSSTLRNHIYKEDRILFETVDAVLDRASDDLIFEQLVRFMTTLDQELLDGKIKDLRSLEWKYLSHISV
jgi:hemerythrin-like domain-containing protein